MELLCITHPDCAAHVAPQAHPERPERLEAALEGVRAGAPAIRVELAEEATPAQLERVHDAAQLAVLDEACREGAWLDEDTYAVPASARAYRLAAGAAAAGARAVLRGDAAAVISCARPPGHHASRTQAMGFCLVNNVAVAVEEARATGCRRVAVVDWDVHHGNGTQEIFWRDGDVLLVSLQQWPLWPLSGREDETGEGAGAGATRNLCLAPGTGPDAYLGRFADEVVPAVERFVPDLVVVSCGFDAHRDDPLASLELESSTYGRLTTLLVESCARLGVPRPLVVLEGGYALGALRDSAAAVASALTS